MSESDCIAYFCSDMRSLTTLMCPKHWEMLEPKDIAMIEQMFKVSKESGNHPTLGWVLAMSSAQLIILTKELKTNYVEGVPKRGVNVSYLDAHRSHQEKHNYVMKLNAQFVGQVMLGLNPLFKSLGTEIK